MATDITTMGDIELDEFRRGPLGRWLDDKSAAHAAASESLWLATCRHARQHCTIIVRCPDMAAVRLVREKLDAYFTDEPSLMKLRPKFTIDTVSIAGVRILTLPRDSSRRPRNVAATIEMANTRGEAATAAPHTDEALAVQIAHTMTCLWHDGTRTGPLFDTFGPLKEVPYEHRDQYPLASSLTPSGTLDQYLGTPQRTRIVVQRDNPTERDVTSLEFERGRAAKMGLSDLNGSNPTVLRGSRRWR